MLIQTVLQYRLIGRFMKRKRKQPKISLYQVISLAAVIVLPLVYGFLYLWAFWDPYGALKKLPVAVVNLDQGGTQKGEAYSLGDRLVTNLKQNQALEWHFVSLAEAETGLTQKNYYAVLTIPENFSQNVLSAETESPQMAQLSLKSREASNFMAAKFSESATIRLVAEINREVEGEYWHNVFVSLREISQKLGDAHDGATQLGDGLAKLADGQKQLGTGIKTALDGDRELGKGLTTAKDGSHTLLAGIKEIQEGQNKLGTGLGALQVGLVTLKGNVPVLQSSMSQIQTGIQANQAGVDQARSLLQDPVNIELVKAILGQVSGGLAQVSGGAASVSAGLNQVSVGVAGLTAGSAEAVSGNRRLADGLTTAVAGADKLAAGLDSLDSGNRQLESGLTKLSDGSGELLAGIDTLKEGNETLSSELAKGQHDVWRTANPQAESKKTAVLAEPVDYVTDPVAKVPDNGTGFAPYFIPLSLWVGAMALFIIRPGKTFTLSNIGLFGAVGATQALVLTVLLQTVLGLKPVFSAYFVSFAVLLSWCYLLIQGMINHLLGEAGKFVNIVLLMLQITSSAGSYPLETSPTFFQTISPHLPMTYAVSAFRELISGGNLTIAFTNMTVIVYLGIGFYVANTIRQILEFRYVRQQAHQG